MNKQEATRRVEKCIRKTSDIITIRAVESGKRSLEQVAMSHVYSAVVSELEAENARLQGDLEAAREANTLLWKFYDFMFSVDATNDAMELLQSDMYAGAQHEMLTGDSQMNRDAVQVWADYDALLTELKELKASK